MKTWSGNRKKTDIGLFSTRFSHLKNVKFPFRLGQKPRGLEPGTSQAVTSKQESS